jgi:hypothetical protein
VTITLGADPPVALAPNRTTLRRFSKQCGRVGNRWIRGGRCHGRVTTKRELGELTGYGLRQFQLVRAVRDSLRDSAIQPMSDWGSSVLMSAALRRHNMRFYSYPLISPVMSAYAWL